MATTTITSPADHDIESAVIAVDFQRSPTRLLAALVYSARILGKCRIPGRQLTFLQVIKLTVGAVVGTLSLVAAWWALDLAMWTSVKDFRDDCREQLQQFNVSSTACSVALSRPLRAPPTWRSHVDSATAWNRNAYAHLEAEGVSFQRDDGRKYLASCSARPSFEVAHDELDFDHEPWQIPMWSDPDSRDVYVQVSGQEDFIFAYPLSETRQERHDELWDSIQSLYECRVWVNATVSGSVMQTQLFPVPSPLRYSEAFEAELARLMPVGTASQWRSECVLPALPDGAFGPVGSGLLQRLVSTVDHGTICALTFILVALGHEVVYGGFARKTRWKWQ